MAGFRNLLFPVDFSERCRATVPFVLSMARKFGAKVTLIHALHEIPRDYYDVDLPVSRSLDEMQRDAESDLMRFLEGLDDVARAVGIGDPAHVITGYAEKNNIDLIMMPTHGYGPFRSLLLGSATAKVLHDARCAVWTGAHMEQPPTSDHLDCRSVLCAVDGTPKTAPLVDQAAKFSGEVGASLRLVHVIPGLQAGEPAEAGGEFEHMLREGAIERLKTFVDVDVPLCIGAGNVAEAVAGEARRHNADLVVIGRGLLHQTLGRLRTHAYAIIRQAPCPVLSF